MIRATINDNYKELSSFIVSIPSCFSAIETILYQGRNDIRKIEYNDERLVIKRFNSSSFLKRFIATFVTSKARKAYFNALKLNEKGIASPLPIAYIEEKNRIGLVGKSYLVTTFTDMKPISDEMNEFDEFNKVLMKDFARFAANLHQSGIIHNDLNSTNVRFQIHEDHYSFSVIDINRMKIYTKQPPSIDCCLEDLTRFCSFTDMYKYFILEYLKARGWSVSMYERALYIKQKHDRRYDRRKMFLGGIKRLWNKFM